MKFLVHIFNDLFIIYLGISLIVLPISSKYGIIVYAQSMNNCDQLLKDAENYYKDGRFEQAIELLTQCLNKDNISEDTQMATYKLLGLTYLAIDYRNDARTAISKLLDLVPNYTIDPNDPPQLVSLIESEMEKREGAKEEIIAAEIPIQTKQKSQKP